MTSNASASAAGFGYQYERALHRIFHSTNPGTYFGIETADDVEEQIPGANGTTTIWEQNKLTTGKKYSLQDSSKNVWNTLRNWLKKLADASSKYNSIEFVLVTNRTVPDKALVSTLSKADTPSAVAAAVKALRDHASKMSGVAGEIAAEVMTYTDADLTYVISRFHVADSMNDQTLKDAIYAALQFPEGMEDSQHLVYEGLMGQLFNECQTAWKKGTPYWTTAKPFFNRKHMLIEKFLEDYWKPLAQAETEFKALIDEYPEIKPAFIEQLENINLRPKLLQEELGHYWAAYSERARLLRLNRILPSDLSAVEEELCDKWKANQAARCVQENKDPEDFNAQDFLSVYQLTSTPHTFELEIGRVKSKFRYLFMGTYHHQANGGDGIEHPIHWHKDPEGDQ